MVVMFVFTILECSLRFSRSALDVDTGVSTVRIDNGDDGFGLSFEATEEESKPLPIVQGPGNFDLPSGCVITSLEVNCDEGWIPVSHGGFSVAYGEEGALLQVNIHFLTVDWVLSYSATHRLMDNHHLKLSSSIINLSDLTSRVQEEFLAVYQ